MLFAFDILIINIDIIHFQFALKYLLCCTLCIKNNTSKFEYQGGCLTFGNSIDTFSDDIKLSKTRNLAFFVLVHFCFIFLQWREQLFLECLWLRVVTKTNTGRKRWCDRLKCYTLLASEENYWAQSIQPKFLEISVQNSTDWFGPTGKVLKKWSTFWGGPLFPVGPVWILVEWITPIIINLIYLR